MIEGKAGRLTVRASTKGLLVNLRNPPLSDRRFWWAQLMVVVVFFVQVGADFAQDHAMIPIPDFVWILLVFIPVVYAGMTFGLVGSLGTALTGIVALAPPEMLLRHTGVELWGAWSIFAVVLVTAVLLGYRFEKERGLREQLHTAESARMVNSLEGHPLSWQRLLEALPYGICLVDAKGSMCYTNERLEALSGYRKDDLVGQPVEILVPSRDRSRHVSMRDGFANRGVIRPHGTSLILALLRKDGTELPVDIALTPFAFEGTSWVVVMIRDDSARVEAEHGRTEAERYATEVEVEARRALAKSERRFRLAFENNAASMAIADLEGSLVDVNRSYCEMLGYADTELLGRDLIALTHPEDRFLTAEMHRRLVTGEVDQVGYTKRYMHKDGHVIYGDIQTRIFEGDTDTSRLLIAAIRDVTEERNLAAQLSHQALHDSLTGLPNLALFQDRMTQARERVARDDGRGALFLLDLDDFKGVNDTLGRDVGDQLLLALARRLESVTRPSDSLSRLGGDEFAYFAEGIKGTPEAEEMAQRLLDVFTEPFLIAGIAVEQSASIGVVVCDAGGGRDWGELIQDVDTAMYEAKRRGKARQVLFSPEMRQRNSNRFMLAQDLSHALEDGEISMHYQPIVDLANGEVVGYESLMRWQHPERGLVPPDVFIPLSEQSDLILTLGDFALRESIAEAATWEPTRSDARAPYIAVNLSARQFHDPRLVSTIKDVLASSHLAPERLVLEITESIALSDIESAIRAIESLQLLETSVALDDFGTGYSSLSYLAMLRPNVIKVDRSFVNSAERGAYAERLLEGIISLCHLLDMTVLAEGIETPAQLARLRRYGCQYGQGYLFSPAVPAFEVTGMGDRVSSLLAAAVARSV